jgi:hypothetical protein
VRAVVSGLPDKAARVDRSGSSSIQAMQAADRIIPSLNSAKKRLISWTIGWHAFLVCNAHLVCMHIPTCGHRSRAYDQLDCVCVLLACRCWAIWDQCPCQERAWL